MQLKAWMMRTREEQTQRVSGRAVVYILVGKVEDARQMKVQLAVVVVDDFYEG